MNPDDLIKRGLPILAANRAQYIAAIARDSLRTIHVPEDAQGALTWEEFRLAMEEATGLRFADDQGEAQVVEPLALPAPDMHTETPNPIHDTQTQGSQKCD